MTGENAMQNIGDLIPTLPRTGCDTGISCRVRVTPDQRAAVLSIGLENAGYDLAGLDTLIAALTGARAILADAAAPTPERVLTGDGHTKHTCTPDGKALPFGRKAPRGECARCDELRDGAAPREDHATCREVRTTVTQRDRDRRAHRATCHACQTGGVCTAFDW